MLKAEQALRDLAKLHAQAEYGPWLCVVGEKAHENWILCSTGAHPVTDEQVYVTTDRLRVSECRGNGAEADAQWIAATRTLAPVIARHLDTVMQLLLAHRGELPAPVEAWLRTNVGTGDVEQGELL